MLVGGQMAQLMNLNLLMEFHTVPMSVDSHAVAPSSVDLSDHETSRESVTATKSSVHILVVDGATGHPLEGAEVRVADPTEVGDRWRLRNRGSWDPTDRWGTAGGRIYATAMAVMILRIIQEK